MLLVRDTRVFYPVMIASLAICALLYAEEAITFRLHGWKAPTDRDFLRESSFCKAVPGKPDEVECPIQVYGWQRYRIIHPEDPVHRYMVAVERIQ